MLQLVLSADQVRAALSAYLAAQYPKVAGPDPVIVGLRARRERSGALTGLEIEVAPAEDA